MRILIKLWIIQRGFYWNNTSLQWLKTDFEYYALPQLSLRKHQPYRINLSMAKCNLGIDISSPWLGRKLSCPSFPNTSAIGYTQLNDNQNDSFSAKKDPKVSVQLQNPRGSASFHCILFLITSRAHQTQHNYSNFRFIYSNAVSPSLW